ncbi:MAG: hypothetical protein JXA81_14685 [Sedimentisphaerales bacterium]|nr:hypothetical protein [Sedimentisphaerales bacterium]
MNLQNGRLEGYPHVFVPPGRYDHIQQKLRAKGRWILSHARTSVINNFKRMFDRILKAACIKAGTFHDLRKTAMTNWFYKGLISTMLCCWLATQNMRRHIDFISKLRTVW